MKLQISAKWQSFILRYNELNESAGEASNEEKPWEPLLGVCFRIKQVSHA